MVQSDERITEVEWDARKKCPICEDIRDKKINLDGEQLFEDNEKKQPFFCPQCGVLDIQLHHEIGALEIGRTATRGMHNRGHTKWSSSAHHATGRM